ncbi:hypothetical protein BDB01DRAFT_796223 [Pilobolus umbonatus]|nr:hypothetical protein BDB01DRAFT_796223 [Pilobolus umbonatus]
MDDKLYNRLDLLADNTLSTIYERNRLKGLKLNVDKYNNTVNRNLTQLREGLGLLEQQLSTQEQTGTKDTQSEEDRLIQLQVKVDRLDGLVNHQSDEQTRALLLSKQSTSKSVKFQSMDPSQMESGQLLQLQQRIIDDQDEDLDKLSSAIKRQRELGIMIGDELEMHAEIIDETDTMVDRTDERLRKARKRLDHVGRRVKDNKSVCIVIGLILLFFILVALFH